MFSRKFTNLLNSKVQPSLGFNVQEQTFPYSIGLQLLENYNPQHALCSFYSVLHIKGDLSNLVQWEWGGEKWLL